MSFKVEPCNEVTEHEIKSLLETMVEFLASDDTDILLENVDLVQIPEGFEFHPAYHEVVAPVIFFAEGKVVTLLINEEMEIVETDEIGYDYDDSSVGNPYGEEA